MDLTTTIADLKKQISAFISAREWHQYHSPKNLAMAISCEASELMEHFLWCESGDSYEVFSQNKTEIEHEVSDIAFALIEFCMQSNINLPGVLERKMSLLRVKYPAPHECNPEPLSFDEQTSLDVIKRAVRSFMDERNWGPVNSPKNIAMGIACEAAELMEAFQWVDSAASFDALENHRMAVEHEAADVFLPLLEFCNQTGIDLSNAIAAKMVLMNEKYPVEKSKGKALKYTQF